MQNFGKRALNKAQTRLDILQAVYRLTRDVNLRDLKVKDIVRDLGITEMTFFNYFKKKEDVLGYMMGLWELDLMALQMREPLQGEAAIRRIFGHTAQRYQQHPHAMVNFIAYLATNEIDPHAHDIEVEDRFLLYPELPQLREQKLQSGNEMLTRHLMEKFPAQDPTRRLLRLASSFYGDVLVAHTAGMDLDALYRDSLDLILRDFSKGSRDQ